MEAKIGIEQVCAHTGTSPTLSPTLSAITAGLPVISDAEFNLAYKVCAISAVFEDTAAFANMELARSEAQ